MIELLAVLVGAALAYWLGRRQAREQRDEERRREREAFATGLLVELAVLERALRGIRRDRAPGRYKADLPVNLLAGPHADFVRIFSPATSAKLLVFWGLATDVQRAREFAQSQREVRDQQHHLIRTKAGFALKLLSNLRRALESEGGAVPDLHTVEVAIFPHLPEMPPVVFPELAVEADLDEQDSPAVEIGLPGMRDEPR